MAINHLLALAQDVRVELKERHGLGFRRHVLMLQDPALGLVHHAQRLFRRRPQLQTHQVGTSARAAFQILGGKQGRLYGSITSQDIAAGLRTTEGINIDRRLIDMPDPIRAIGTYTVPVKVASKLQPKITVNVVDEKAGDETTANAVSAEA